MISKTSWFITIGTLVGVVGGALAGYYMPGFFDSTKFLGQLFINALRIVIVPLIAVSVVLGIGTLASRKRVGKTLVGALLYFTGTTAVAIIIGMLVVNVVNPGQGVDVAGQTMPEAVRQARTLSEGDIISGLIPHNPLILFTGDRFFALVLLSFVIGVILATMGQRRRAVIDFLRPLNDAVMRLVQWVMVCAPVGLFFFVGHQVSLQVSMGSDLVSRMGTFMLALAIGLVIHAVIVLPLVLKLWGNRPLLPYLGKLIPAFSTAAGTGVPAISLPATQHAVVNEAKVDNRAAATVLPLGATMNLDATAMWSVMAMFFVIQAMGLPITIGQVLIIGLGTLVASICSAGVPMAGMIILVAIMNLAGFPEAAFPVLALVMATNFITERARAVVEVWSDAVGASVVARQLTASSSRPQSRAGRTTDPRSIPTRPTRDNRSRERTPSPRGSGGRQRDDRSRSDRDPRRGRDRQPRQDDRRTDRDRGRNTGRSAAPTSAPQARAKVEDSPFAIKQEGLVDLSQKPAESKSPRPKDGPRGRSTSRPNPARKPSEPRRPRQSDSPRDTRPGPKPAPPRPTHKDDLEKDLVAREQARIKEQLVKMDAERSPSRPEPTASRERPEPPKPSETTKSPEQPRIDYASPSWEKQAPAEKPEPAPAPEKQTKAAPTASPDQGFGRSRRRSGKAPAGKKGPSKPDSQVADSSSDEPSKAKAKDAMADAQSSFATGSQSFGRGRRPRTRR